MARRRTQTPSKVQVPERCCKAHANRECFDLVADATPEAKQVREIIMAFMTEHGYGYTGGCKAFYTPEAWAARGEDYGHGGVLVVVHDGGDLGPICNWSYGCYNLIEGLNNKLSGAGFFMEQATSWYSAVYRR